MQGNAIGDGIGAPWGCEKRDSLKSRIVFVKEPFGIHENIMLSGEIPVGAISKHINPTPGFVKRNSDGDYEVDWVIDGQYLIVEGNKGIYLFGRKSCSHALYGNSHKLLPEKQFW